MAYPFLMGIGDSVSPGYAAFNSSRHQLSGIAQCYVGRRGYREGATGFLIALMAGLYPLISHLKARIDRDAGADA